VTATERATGLAKHVVIDSATERFRRSQSTNAVDRLEAVFGTLEHPYEPLGALAGPHQNLEPSGTSSDDLMTPSLRQAVESAQALVAKAKGLESDANDEDAEELRAMLVDLQAAVERGSEDDIRVALREVEELVFYLEDA
jgi:molecular chaperone DnaK